MGCRRPQHQSVLDNGPLTDRGTLFSRCPLSGPFRSMIEPQHQNSRSFAIKRINTLRSCSYRLDATFTSRHKATPVTIQKINQSRLSDVMQRWENGPGLHTFRSSGRAGGTCLVPKGQRSRGCEIGSVLFPQRPGCEYADNQSHSR